MKNVQPHIIYILSDQHNPYCAGFAGNQLADTPNLDRLAAGGVSFANCYCNSPLCVPSRSSLLAGRLPVKTGVYNNLQCLRTDEATFATCLTVGGYETVLAGRMHFVGYDQRHGFEKRLVGDVGPSFPRPQRQKSLYGFLHGTPDQSRVSIDKSGAGESAVTYFDRAVTDAACSYLRNREDSRPLFLMVGYYNPHCPFVAPQQYYDKYYERLKNCCEAEQVDLDSVHPAIRKFLELRGIERITDEELHRVRAAYYANVEYLDSLIGEIICSAKENLGTENTIILYGSDHGEMLGAHGMFWKSNFYEESARVPMIISWPGHYRQGVTSKDLVSLVDLAPTLSDMGHITHLPAEDGRSLLPLLTGQGEWEERAVLSMLIDLKGDRPSAMIRKGNYKLIKWCGYDLPMLFDLTADPQEENNLAARPEYRAITEQLTFELVENWKEEEAIVCLEQGKKQADMLKKWTAAVCPDYPEEWWCPSENNYIVGREIKQDTAAGNGKDDR